MRRNILLLVVVSLCPLLGLLAWRATGRQQLNPPGSAPAKTPPPLAQVTLFNTGLGHFQHEGEIEGEARLDLVFPAENINDVLKTLTVDDGGRTADITYDSTEPIEHSLQAFAVDLAGNPTLGQILTLVRGEQAEVEVEKTPGGASEKLSGRVVGMEALFEGKEEVHRLNVYTSDGLRRLPLSRVLRVRFSDQKLEEEFRRALQTLADGRSNQRRRVSIHLQGAGKRIVKIGYVLETAIWKPTYRLALAADGKARLAGHAIIENTTSLDWTNVRLTLASGRPISFEMDLSKPLFVPRPSVQPEVYASLQPPTPGVQQRPSGFQSGFQSGWINLGGSGTHIGGRPNPGQPRRVKTKLDEETSDSRIENGIAVVRPDWYLNRYQVSVPVERPARKVTYDELRQRRDELVQQRQAEASVRNDPSVIARQEAMESIALDASRIGEDFTFTFDRKVSVPRQKSAMLAFLDAPVELSRLSVYNRSFHPRFPIHSLNLKNTVGRHLRQGPVAITEAAAYVGDARLPDLRPGQLRLISYAMDQGVEIQTTATGQPPPLKALEVLRGFLHTSRPTFGTVTSYQISNRSNTDRDILIEHPRTADYELAETAKPNAVRNGLYHFNWKAQAGKTLIQTVAEQKAIVLANEALHSMSDDRLAFLLEKAVMKDPVRDGLTKMRDQRRQLADMQAELKTLEAKRIATTSEQDALRQRLAKLQSGSPDHKIAAEKFEQGEALIGKLAAQVRDKKAAALKQEDENENYARTLTVK